MPGRSRNLRTRHLLWVVLGFFCCALITLGGIVQAGTYTRTVKRFRPIARFATSPTWSYNQPLLSLCLAPSASWQGYRLPPSRYARNSFLYFLSSLDLRLHELPTRKQFCLKNSLHFRRLLMRIPTRSIRSLVLVLAFVFSAMFSTVQAQSNSGSISGSVTDPSGAVVPGATVTIENQVSGYLRTAKRIAPDGFSSAIYPSTPTILR